MKLLSWTILFWVLHSCASLTPSEEEINGEALKAYQHVKTKAKISSHKAWTDMLNRVAPRIARASGENFNWEWMLIDSPEVNAWCMPGGKIAVYTGIMPVLKTEGALAAVLGHEVAHATKRHGKERYARAVKENYGGLMIGIATAIGGQMLCKTETCRLMTGLGGTAAGLALQFMEMKYSRSDESEADKVGQEYMARAGYDPTESISLWDRMGAAAAGSAPPEIFSSHPSDKTRRKRLRQLLPRTYELYRKSPVQYGVGATI